MFMYMVRLFVRIDFDTPSIALGPGKAQLLERLSEYGTLRRAAASMSMSYRTAWLLIEEMQGAFNRAVVTAEIGGTGGGGMKLTELGTNLLKSYRRIEAGATQASQFELEGLAALARANVAPKRAAKRKRSSQARIKNGRLPKRRRESKSRPL
jgi:molybdate transport system regulatory protein